MQVVEKAWSLRNDDMLSYEQAVEKNRQEQMGKKGVLVPLLWLTEHQWLQILQTYLI
jgi:hypothetical protein